VQQVTLWLHVSTVNGHRQADIDHFSYGTERQYLPVP